MLICSTFQGFIDQPNVEGGRESKENAEGEGDVWG